MAKKKDASPPKEEKLFEFPLGEKELEYRRSLARRAVTSGTLQEKREELLRYGDAPWRIIRYRRVIDPRHLPVRLALDSFTTPETFEKHM